ncbi:Gtr1/RagA G protein Gtr2 [Mycotypha africana]|uniref:Gtr1/RagA G protein Gtr2 n=1 Tax=Mycotypha africana TaxID=64632 RepID=UPI0022FFEB3A|nr:Gtr1/RagA G protein Gtr2 [Mycotypha africana]KAI8969082.1 Gtr1/RagA G protein Gtr2 [Mycotypha africana]
MTGTAIIFRSGKSSIQAVVFGNMAPHDTIFLESTSKIEKEEVARSFIDFQIWDFPGQIDYFDDSPYNTREIFGTVGTLVFVIDAQDDYVDALHRLQYTIVRVYQINPEITFEILIHKVDGLTEEHKEDVRNDIITKMYEYLIDSKQEKDIHLFYHMTTIYDNSIYEAFSKIIQKLIRELPALEKLLDILRANSGLEKTYLFDILTKIYIATDSTPAEIDSYELCSDMIDVVVDIDYIYGPQSGSKPLFGSEGTPNDENIINDLNVGSVFDKQSNNHYQISADAAEASAPALKAPSIIKLKNGDILYMKEINSLLVLICMIKNDNYKKYGLLDYNLQQFIDAVNELFAYSIQQRRKEKGKSLAFYGNEKGKRQ